jgi:nicotinate-nucleotide adenylyltransferase
MLDLAIRDYFNNDPRIKIDPTEVHNGQAIPTHALLAQLRAREPQTEFWFIMGADLLKEIERWELGSQLLQETRFIVFDRNVVDS